MLLFVFLFASLLTGCIVSVKKIIKEHEINTLTISSITNVVLFLIIFITSK